MFSLSGSFVPPAEPPACDPEHIDSGRRASTDCKQSGPLVSSPHLAEQGCCKSPALTQHAGGAAAEQGEQHRVILVWHASAR